MNKIVNRRPCILVLPVSKLTLKPMETIEVEELTDEIRNAVSRSWVSFVSQETLPTSSPTLDKENTHPSSPTPPSPSHDWEIDYSRSDEGVVTVSDKVTGRRVEDEIIERKGEEYFTLRELGTVKKQQFWPTAQALERFDDSG